MERKTKRRRGTALFLALVMLASLLPLNVFAESDDIIVQEEAENAEEGLDAEADTMESPEDGDYLLPEDASEDIPAENSPQEEGTQHHDSPDSRSPFASSSRLHNRLHHRMDCLRKNESKITLCCSIEEVSTATGGFV